MLSVNGVKIEPTIFPDGTSQVWKLPDRDTLVYGGPTEIEWLFENEAEFMHLAQLRELVNGLLWMPYLPYARQDKWLSNESTFSRHTFLKLLDSLEFPQVTVFDIHSPLNGDYKGKFVNVSADNLIGSIAEDFDAICYPDAGAAKRYRILGVPRIVGDKVRDQSTGRITHYEISVPPKLTPSSSVLVVDDICDGGATFLMLGEELSERFITKPSLYVSHGIFSKGLGELQKYYHRIFTTDSRPIKHQDLIVYESAPPHRLLQS